MPIVPIPSTPPDRSPQPERAGHNRCSFLPAPSVNLPASTLPPACQPQEPAKDRRPVVRREALQRDESARSHVHKPAVVALEGDRHRRGRPIPMLGDDHVGLPCAGRLALIGVFAV